MLLRICNLVFPAGRNTAGFSPDFGDVVPGVVLSVMMLYLLAGVHCLDDGWID